MGELDYQALMWDAPYVEIAAALESISDVNAPDPYGNHLLASACERMQVEAVKELIARKADLNCRSPNGDTPLICAIDYAHHNPSAAYQIVKLLLDTGADLEARGYMDKTPFLKACSRGCLDILKLLVAHGCDIYAACTDMGGSEDGRSFADIFDAPREFKEYLNGLYEST